MMLLETKSTALTSLEFPSTKIPFLSIVLFSCIYNQNPIVIFVDNCSTVWSSAFLYILFHCNSPGPSYGPSSTTDHLFGDICIDDGTGENY